MQQKAIGSGLQNLGNTCFFNATLQSLLYAPPLAQLLERRGHSEHCSKKHTSQWCVFCQMQHIYNHTRTARSFSPNNMLKHLNKIFKKFRLGRQEDSHQFLRYLIEGMQDSETGKLGKDREENEKKLKKTQVFDVFGGIVKTSVECLSCSRKSITTERYYDFNIECQRASSLLEGISSFFAVDKLEGSNKYLCEFCKVRSNARKRFLLESVPQVATFQLKRFTNTMRKIGKFMQYPLEIDLGKYLEKPEKVVMKLFAIIVHLGGSSFSGHYYAFVRQGNLWFKMDDSYVSKCNLQTVMGQQAYILFYEKEQPEQPPKQPNHDVSEQQQLVNDKNGQNKKQDIKKPQQKSSSDIEIEIIRPNEEKSKTSVADQEKPLSNGTSNHKLPVNGKDHMLSEQLELSQKSQDPLMREIEKLLVQKLINKADTFKEGKDGSQIHDILTKAVKEVITEVTPKKSEFEHNDHKISQQSMEIELPSLKRGKSKEQMQRELPYGQLILRTFDKIMQLRSKMPLKRPHNYSQRSMYNLRDYETKMQKKRKIG